MATAKPKGGLTYADYAATPDDERWELIDGVLYRMAPAPNTKHQQVLFNLVSAFVLHFSRFGQQGQLFFAPTDLILSDGTTVQPDMLFVSEDRRGIITLRGCEGPPDLVVEIPSPSNTAHDLDVKRELYARFGIPEYLILGSCRMEPLSNPICFSYPRIAGG
jgi:Uma2 family endonuclease